MNYRFLSINEAGNLKGKKVFLCADFNVAIVDGKVIDAYRIERSSKTLNFLKESGARTLIVSHRSDESASLVPVYEYLGGDYVIEFANTIDDARAKLDLIADGSFVLLENIRKFKGEIENEVSFSKELASLAEIYVNEAFSVSHRLHASVVGVPKFLPSYAGFLFTDEVENLSKAFRPLSPFVFILAGAKFDTKLPVINKFLPLADSVFIGGALANDLLRAKDFEIGKSAHSSSCFDFSEIIKNNKLMLPIDVVVQNFGKSQEKSVQDVMPEDIIFDIGVRSIEMLRQKINNAKFVLWNGTLGAYEKGFAEGTKKLADLIAKSGVNCVVGGGDTIAAISSQNIFDKFSFVSTAGGAMLDFLANETLPGIIALEQSKNLELGIKN